MGIHRSLPSRVREGGVFPFPVYARKTHADVISAQPFVGNGTFHID